MFDRQRGPGLPIVGAVLIVVCVALLSQASSIASAASPDLTNFPKLGQFPEDTSLGEGANQFNFNSSIATDPTTGHIYVAEVVGNRISEYTAWGEFVKAWGWGVKDGTPTLQTCGPPQPEPSPSPSVCRRGLAGSGAGQLYEPQGIAVEPTGAIYVLENGRNEGLNIDNYRVQKFNAAGEFILMIGGEVDKTTNANVCTAASGDVCGSGIEGTGNGQFSYPSGGTSAITVGSDGTVYVGDQNRIQRFNPSGDYLGQVALPKPGVPSAIAFDPSSEELYYTDQIFEAQPKPTIYRIDPVTGIVSVTIPIERPFQEGSDQGKLIGLVSDSEGDVFVIYQPSCGVGPACEARVLEYGPDGEELIDFDAELAAPALAEFDFLDSATRLKGLAINGIRDLYVIEDNHSNFGTNFSAVAAYGPPPTAFGPPPAVAPVILSQFATTVDRSSATLRAKINPKFWGDTKFYVEYGTSPCFEGGCKTEPLPPGSTLIGSVINAPVTSPKTIPMGLAANTTFHYRFVAESGGGGPVSGLAGKAGAAGESTFTTAPAAVAQPPCPANESFRPGPAAFLPDCRAYEMVSPVDKNGADISVVFNILGDPAGLDQAAVSGEALTFSAYRGFGAAESSPYTSQYLARRAVDGWSSSSISPARAGPSLLRSLGLDSQYKGFGDDLCLGWVLQDADLSLAEGSVDGWPNLYRRNICAGGYEPLAPLKAPSLKETNEFLPELQGFSADGSKAIFTAPGKLKNNASAESQLYEASEGTLRLACILPDKTTLKTGCSAGVGSDIHPNRGANVEHAISEDGSKVYWTASAIGAGKLYVRIESADTVAVSAGVAHFWAASADGATAIYSEDSQLLGFDLASETSSLIAGGFIGILGVSDDGSKVYLVSSEARDAGAISGEPNLYLYEAGASGSFHFIATLSSHDVDNTNNATSATASWPIRHLARVTPDGGAAAFMSTASLTGYDNTDQNSGEANAEVYLYDAGEDQLRCVSCLASGAQPIGRKLKSGIRVSAQIPAAESQLHFPRVLSDDGQRLFFESFDPLSLRDVNSRQDLYEWEAAGTGNCSSAAPGYQSPMGGCVNLISSGESPEDSEFVDASFDGRDVFFKTSSSLLPQDPGLLDVYVARAGGGFPIQQPPPPGCQGESCQNPAPAPNDPTPGSRSYSGPENERPAKKPLRCPKGKHRVTKKSGKQVCEKNKTKKPLRCPKGKHRVTKKSGKQVCEKNKKKGSSNTNRRTHR